MRLTCPNCRSGLEVPDGTTAHVRCPGCATVFPAEAGAAEAVPVEVPPPPPAVRISVARPPAPRPAPPPPPPPPPRTEERLPRPVRRAPRVEDDDDWGDDPGGVKERRHRALRHAFTRAAWGCELIRWSFVAYACSIFFVLIHFLRLSLADAFVGPGIVLVAGLLGLLNWGLAAVGVGLCLSGPPSPGHYRYGVAAAVACGVHLIFMAVLVGRGELPATYRISQKTSVLFFHDLARVEVAAPPEWPERERSTAKWAQLSTRLDGPILAASLAAYSEQFGVSTDGMALGVAAGIAELVRLLLVLMLLSCLAAAAGDGELSHRCGRNAGRCAFAQAALALVVLIASSLIFETNAATMKLAWYLIAALMGTIYQILPFFLYLPAVDARDTAGACESPYQSAEDRLAG